MYLNLIAAIVLFSNIECMIMYQISHYFLDTHIAFNNPATASSIFGGERNRHKFGPQFVTNCQSVCDNAAEPIAHTENRANQWFNVDLQGTFYIKTVVVNPRTSMFYFKM